MASQGPNYPTTVTTTSNAPESANDWLNPTNVGADDGSEASITAATFDSPDVSFRLNSRAYGFTIPAGATINGILVEIQKRDQAIGAAVDYRVQLQDDAGSLVGDNKADTVTDWPTAATTISYGGSTDTWNSGLTAAKINSATFGVILSAQATAANTDIFVDFIRVTIFYTEAGKILTADAGSYSETGQAAGLKLGRNLVAGAASYTMNGSAAGLQLGRKVTAQAGAYTMAGQDALLLQARKLIAGEGAYAETGQDATLTKGGGAKVLPADAGSYSESGAAVGLQLGRHVVAGGGVYDEVGQPATLRHTYVLIADVGAYAESGQAAGLQLGRRVAAEAGTYAEVGQSVTLRLARVLIAEGASYAEAGQPATLVWSGESAPTSYGDEIINPAEVITVNTITCW